MRPHLAAEYLRAPISLVSLVDETRQWFKSRHGIELEHTPREFSFCAHAILAPGDVFEVRDAQQDLRFSDNPLVTGKPGVRFYAGVSLVTHDGRALGTLNVIDVQPRRLDARQKDVLVTLGRQVTAQLELRRQGHELREQVEARAHSEAQLRREFEKVIDELRDSKAFTEHVTQIMPGVLYVYDFTERRNVFVNREVVDALGYSRADLMGASDDPVMRFMHPDDQAMFGQHMRQVQALRDEEVAEFTYRMRHADGDWRWFERVEGTERTLLGLGCAAGTSQAFETAQKAAPSNANVPAIAAKE